MQSDRLLKEKEVETVFGIPYRTLQAQRFRKNCCSIPYIKIGRAVWYDPADIRAWLERAKRCRLPDGELQPLCNTHSAHQSAALDRCSGDNPRQSDTDSAAHDEGRNS